MKRFDGLIDEVLCNEECLEEGKGQVAYSLYLREMARLKTAKSSKESMECLARMVALSPHIDFGHARKIAGKK